MKNITSMSDRKLRGMKKITKKNFANSIGQINRFFFNNPVYKLTGIHKITDVHGGAPLNKYLCKYEVYGGCHKETIEAPFLPLFQPPMHYRFRFQFESMYTNSAITIGIGARYKIYGNRLVIMQRLPLRIEEFVIASNDQRYLEDVKKSKMESIVSDLKMNLALFETISIVEKSNSFIPSLSIDDNRFSLNGDEIDEILSRSALELSSSKKLESATTMMNEIINMLNNIASGKDSNNHFAFKCKDGDEIEIVINFDVKKYGDINCKTEFASFSIGDAEYSDFCKLLVGVLGM